MRNGSYLPKHPIFSSRKKKKKKKKVTTTSRRVSVQPPIEDFFSVVNVGESAVFCSSLPCFVKGGGDADPVLWRGSMRPPIRAG